MRSQEPTKRSWSHTRWIKEPKQGGESTLVVVRGNRKYSSTVIGSPKELSYSNWQAWPVPLIMIFFWHFLYFLTALTLKSTVQIFGGSCHFPNDLKRLLWRLRRRLSWQSAHCTSTRVWVKITSTHGKDRPGWHCRPITSALQRQREAHWRAGTREDRCLKTLACAWGYGHVVHLHWCAHVCGGQRLTWWLVGGGKLS